MDSSSLARELDNIRSELSDTISRMQDAPNQYTTFQSKDEVILWSKVPTDSKEITTAYYLLAKELVEHITKADRILIKVTAIMEQADGLLLPSLVKECDEILERYMLFRKQTNQILTKNDQAFLHRDTSPSPALIQKQLRELQGHCKYFLDFLQ